MAGSSEARDYGSAAGDAVCAERRRQHRLPVVGEGPLDVVHVYGFVGNLDVEAENAGHEAFFQPLASVGRVIRFDRRGTGLSDRSAMRALRGASRTFRSRLCDTPLGFGPLGGRLLKPPRHSLSREVGLALSAQHEVVLVHVHTTAAGRDFIRLGHDRHTACMTLVHTAARSPPTARSCGSSSPATTRRPSERREPAESSGEVSRGIDKMAS